MYEEDYRAFCREMRRILRQASNELQEADQALEAVRSLLEPAPDADIPFSQSEQEFKRTRPERRAFYRQFRKQPKKRR